MACATDSMPDRESEHRWYSTIVNVRNIDEQMTDETLKELFSPYGILTSYKVMTSSNVELGRFGYVAFEDPDAAEEAIIELNGQELVSGQRLALRRTHEKIVRRVADASPKIPRISTIRNDIIVNNLHPDMDEKYLKGLFGWCGFITSCRIIRAQGISKGYGFVTFVTHKQAVTAMEKMHRKIVKGRSLFVGMAHGTDYSKSTREPQVKMAVPWRTNHSNAETSSDSSVRGREPTEELRRAPPPTPLPVSPRNEPASSFVRDFYACSGSNLDEFDLDDALADGI